MDKLITITQLSTMLNLVNKKTKKPSNHILRFWEKKFKQIRPTQLNSRRYYTNEQVEIIKLIKYLLKDKGFTINGVKKWQDYEYWKMMLKTRNCLYVKEPLFYYDGK